MISLPLQKLADVTIMWREQGQTRPARRPRNNGKHHDVAALTLLALNRSRKSMFVRELRIEVIGTCGAGQDAPAGSAASHGLGIHGQGPRDSNLPPWSR